MALISIETFQFFLIVFLLYWLCPSRMRWVILLMANIVYIWLNNSVLQCMIMGIMIFVAWFSAMLIKYTDNKHHRMIAYLAVVFEIFILVWLKDIQFFTNICSVVFQRKITVATITAPLGISYYTLSLVSYILDVYWESAHAQTNILKFATYAGFFPLLQSGPIVRYNEEYQAIFDKKKFSYEKMCMGCQRIIWGCFKKLVIAERISVIVSTVYNDYYSYHGIYIWIAVMLFPLQLYTDFSGCIDIIMGMAEMLGIELPENFQTPFASTSISEFWRRWHITLGAWLRDYVLYPVLKSKLWQKIGKNLGKKFGKKAGKKMATWLGMFISWFLIGFWHGGAWNYIIGVGLWFWAVIVFGEAVQLYRGKKPGKKECGKWKSILYAGRTYIIFALGLGMFRSYNGIAEGLKIYGQAFRFNKMHVAELGLASEDVVVLLVALIVLFTAGILREKKRQSLREYFMNKPIAVQWTLWTIMLFSVILFGKYGTGYNASDFIYVNF